MKLLQWFIKVVLTVMLVSSLTLLTTGLIVQSYVKSLLASFNIQWEGQPMGLTAMFQGALGGKAVEEKKPGTGTTDQPAGAEEEHVPEDAISVMGNGTGSGEPAPAQATTAQDRIQAQTGIKGQVQEQTLLLPGLAQRAALVREQTQMLAQTRVPIQEQQLAIVQHRETELVRVPWYGFFRE